MYTYDPSIEEAETGRVRVQSNFGCIASPRYETPSQKNNHHHNNNKKKMAREMAELVKYLLPSLTA